MDSSSAFKFCPKCGAALKMQDYDGQTVPRCESKACGFIFWQNSKPCIVVIIKDRGGKVLMTIRGIEPEKGKLDLPGGFMKLGEYPKEAAKREVKEELGVEIEVGEFVGFTIDNYFYQETMEKTLSAGYMAKVTSGDIRAADMREIAGIEWVDPYDFDPAKLAFEGNEKFLRMIS